MKPVMLCTLVLTLLVPLAACTQSGTTGSQPGTSATTATASSTAGEMASPSWVASKVRAKMQEARLELATKNIKVNSVRLGNHHGQDSRPEAEITPQGDLLIAGKKVEATPTQHAMLLDYRKQIVGIAEKGMDIGTQGADLGLNAAREALRGAFSGKSDKEIEAAIKPQTDKIRTAAAQLCERLPDLLASQQKLAAAMPAFKPYATMTAHDIDKCRDDAQKGDSHPDQ